MKNSGLKKPVLGYIKLITYQLQITKKIKLFIKPSRFIL